ncbi:MAG: outer membrane protein assembly factor BamA [Alphaproteobacteria bacterium]
MALHWSRRVTKALGVAGLVLVTLFAAPVPASAQSGGTIAAIQVLGNQRIEEGTVRSYLSVQPGDPFDDDALDRSLKNLYASSFFEDVALRREGDTLIVEVVENPIINRIAFEGNLRLDDATLEPEVQLRPRVVYTRSRVQNAVSRILELYRRNGRFAATVEPKIIELPENRVDLVFEINEGPLTQVGRILFVGNEAFSDSTLRDVIQTQETAWWRFLTSNDTYDPDRLAFDQELLRRHYLARGYVDFNVRSALAELTPDGKTFVITFTLDEGEQYEVGKVTIDSRLRDLKPEQLQQLVKTESGEVYNADDVEGSITALTDEIGKLGYAFVDIEPDLEKRPDERTIDLTYVINEGARVYIERIDVIGNVRTLDEVVRREFRLSEGDAFNTALLRRSRQRIQNLGYFEKVDLRTLPGSAPDKTRIEIEVVEKSTGELSFGAGYSTSDGALGDVRLTERNLLGTGRSVTANFRLSERRQEIDFSLTEPYFLDTDITAGVDLFRTVTDFQDESSFDQTTTGGALRASYPLTEHLRHGVKFTLRQDEIKDVDNEASEFIQAEEGKDLSILLGQTLTYDRRDTRFLPTEGYILRFDQEVAGFGGDTQYLKHELIGSYYYPFTPSWVLNLAARGGHIFGYGGEDVRLFDRFFLGGSTLRGFRFAGVGPRDGLTDDALGGNTLATGTAELRFPLGLPEDLRMFGRVFVEGGTLTGIDVPDGVSDDNLLDSGSLRASTGIGLSWLSPLGPISIDFSDALLKEDEDTTESFRVSFGTRF